MRMRGRGIVRGRCEARAVVLYRPFSFLGGVDPSTGRLTLEDMDRVVAGCVFVFPRGKGSTVGSYVILDMKLRGTVPGAIVNECAEPIVATGAVMAEVPMVDGLDISLISDGDIVIVDGDEGTVELPEVREVDVVTSVLKRGEKVLILRRSAEVGSYPGKWAGVSGYIEPGEEPLETAQKEVREEVGICVAGPVVQGDVVSMRNSERVWNVHPFLFETEGQEVMIDWEHGAHLWTTPQEAARMDTVPDFERVLKALGLLP